MNILVPDSWLREYLKTKATPSQIKEYLSLCGPSVERITKDRVYEIEITSNRPDSMSIFGVAREAAAILPRFGIPAKLALQGVSLKGKESHQRKLKLTVKTDSKLNPRWTSVVFDDVNVGVSPKWLSEWLELSGIRSINNVIDVTNFLMRAFGQPAHVFDYDTISGHSMKLRASKKREKITTLDGKTHTLPGDDIVIEDGSGKLIDLCGIMGGKNSSVTDKTTRVILFLQTYDPSHIRKTSMMVSHRTEAASLFEKGLDTESIMPVFLKGVSMMQELTGGKIASAVTDMYPSPYKSNIVSVNLSKIVSYIGDITEAEIKKILEPLGFTVKKDLHVVVPSFRRDVTLDVDIIEEIARIYGYHNITSTLPKGELPMTIQNPMLFWEEETKIRLRDWGYTELLTYSMISEEQMDTFVLDKSKAYKISNPLSNEWLYMRPSLLPSVLSAVKQNLNIREDLKLFELSFVYELRQNDLPLEKPMLIVVWTGKKYPEAKGLAEALFDVFGIPFPEAIKEYGSIEILAGEITVLYLDFSRLVANAKPIKTYKPIPKYPPIVEDLAFVVPEQFEVGPLIALLKKAHPLPHRPHSAHRRKPPRRNPHAGVPGFPAKR